MRNSATTFAGGVDFRRGFLFLAALFVAARVDRPLVIGMLFEPAVGEDSADHLTSHRLPDSCLTERFVVAEGEYMREKILSHAKDSTPFSLALVASE